MNEFGVDTSFGSLLDQSAVDDLTFFIHRIGTLGTAGSGTSAYYNKTLTPDTGCRPNITLVQTTNNKPAGVYFFSYAWNNTSAEVEADKVCDVLDAWGFNPRLGVYFDWETTNSPSGSYENLINIGITPTTALLQGFFKAWSDRIRARGYQAGIYTNQTIVANYLTDAWVQAQRNSGVYFWLAQWNVANPSYNCDLWQYYAGANGLGVSWHGITVDYDKVQDDRVLNGGSSNIPLWLKVRIVQGSERNGKYTVLL